MYKIQEFFNGHKSRRHLYEKEKTFLQYWKYHSKETDWFITRHPSRDIYIIAYKNGEELGRYGEIAGLKVNNQPEELTNPVA